VSDLAVTGLGCHSAVGLGVAQTCAAIRAGIMRLQSYPDYVPQAPDLAEGPPEPTAHAPAPGLPSGAGLERRLGALAARALRDLLRDCTLGRQDFRRMHLLLALPEKGREGIEDLDAGKLLQGVRRSSSLEFEAGEGAFHDGHCAALLALDEARRIVTADGAARCLILAVDSNVLDGNLDWLDRSWRLKSQRNVDGFVPGEAGVAILVEGAATAARRRAPILARIAGIGGGEEPSPSSSDAQSTGAGLTAAIRAACPEMSGRPVRWVVCDMNGESYRGREWGVVLTRLGPGFDSPAVWHPATSVGDVGAASGALQLAMVCRAFARGYAPAAEALVWCASDSSRRSAGCIRSAAGERTN
jgi:3-oxoacyl-[acyl-carrier-protein] synthase-1